MAGEREPLAGEAKAQQWHFGEQVEPTGGRGLRAEAHPPHGELSLVFLLQNLTLTFAPSTDVDVSLVQRQRVPEACVSGAGLGVTRGTKKP